MLLVWIVGAASSRDLHYRDKYDSRLEAAPTIKPTLKILKLTRICLPDCVAISGRVGTAHQISAVWTVNGGRCPPYPEYDLLGFALFEKAVTQHQLPADLLSEAVALYLAIGIVA